MEGSLVSSIETANIRPLLLKDEAFSTLEKMIVTGVLSPGQWVSETDLMQVSGHTRASVRHAVQRLEDQELVKIFPRRGAQICPIDYNRHFRLLELRRPVEQLLARSAAKRASPQQRAQFENISNGFRENSVKKVQEVMTELDSQNYALLLAAADNPFASKAMMAVKGLSRRFWVLHCETHGDVGKMASSHADIAAAIAAADGLAAETAVANLVDYLERFTLEVVGFNSERLEVV
ncbi:MAG: GntR family transcriptional regulator [Hyphomicrobiales bacterium]